MGGRKTLFDLLEIRILKYILWNIQNNSQNKQSLFFIIILVTNVQTVYKIVTKGTHIVILHTYFSCQIYKMFLLIPGT
jgi:hypothetical protein